MIVQYQYTNTAWFSIEGTKFVFHIRRGKNHREEHYQFPSTKVCEHLACLLIRWKNNSKAKSFAIKDTVRCLRKWEEYYQTYPTTQ